MILKPFVTERAEQILDDLKTLPNFPTFEITNAQNGDSFFYDAANTVWKNAQPTSGETFKGLLDVSGNNFETGFLNVPDNGYFATATTGANIDNRNLTQNKIITNANVVSNTITFYCGLNPPNGTNPNLVINPINQVILINATNFTNINFNVDLSSTALNPTGFIGQGTMTNSVDITLYVGLSGSTNDPFAFFIQNEKKFVFFPEQYLVLSLRLSNQGFPNAASIDNNTNYYSRVEYLDFKYIPAVAITTTNPTSITFSSLDNQMYYLMNDLNSKTAQTSFHCSYFKLPTTRNANVLSNPKFYDVFNVKQYTITGYSDAALGFVPDPLTQNLFTTNPTWCLKYNYNAAREAQIIAALPVNAYLPLFCSIKPKPLFTDLVTMSNPEYWDPGARISKFLLDFTSGIFSVNFLDQIENFVMVLVDKNNLYWLAKYFDGVFSLTQLLGNASSSLSGGFRSFQFYIGNSFYFVNNKAPYPWNTNLTRSPGFFGSSNTLSINGTAVYDVEDFLYPPIMIQGGIIFNNTGSVLNSIGACFFESGLNNNPSLNLPSNVMFPEKIFTTNIYTFFGTGWASVNTAFQTNAPTPYATTNYLSSLFTASNYFI